MKVDHDTIKYFLEIASSIDPKAIKQLSKNEQNLLLSLFNAYEVQNIDISQKKLLRIQQHLLLPSAKPYKFNENQALIEKMAILCHKLNIIPINPNFIKLIHQLPDYLPSSYLRTVEKISEKEIEQLAEFSIIKIEPIKTLEDNDTYEEVLAELDRLKERLGGSPNYAGLRPPAIDDNDKDKTFLGVPLPAVKDWFRKVLNEGWEPKFFWEFCAKKLFDISKEYPETRYEYAAKAIQRFGILTNNKELFLNILAKDDRQYYSLFNHSTGMAWHPTENGVAVEKEYMTLVDQFLTTHFEQAKAQGDDALIEYFNAFNGVCFEDRARNIEDFIRRTSPDSIQLAAVADYNAQTPLEEIFLKENSALYYQLKRLPTPKELNDHLVKKGVLKSDDSKKTPLLETFHNWILEQQENCIVDLYERNDFLEIEYQILMASEKEISLENFIDQIKTRSLHHSISLHSSSEKDNEEKFQISSIELADWFQRKT